MWNAIRGPNGIQQPCHAPAPQLAIQVSQRHNRTSVLAKRSSVGISDPPSNGQSPLPITGKTCKRNTTGQCQTLRMSAGTPSMRPSNHSGQKTNDGLYSLSMTSSPSVPRKPTHTRGPHYAHPANANLILHHTSLLVNTMKETSYSMPLRKP